MVTAEATTTVQQYKVYIKAAPEAVWDAITKKERTQKYGYAPLVEYDLRRGGKFRMLANDGMKAAGMPDVVGDGEVLEVSKPNRLVQTWRMLMDAKTKEEGFTRLSYDIQPVRGGVTRLIVTHDVSGAPQLASMLAGEHESEGAGGGWSEVLSGLKTLLETGSQLPFQSGPQK